MLPPGVAGEELYDCLVIGGGPAGSLAAIYLARFRRKVALIDAGHPRARWIPRTRNVPGFPDGLEGAELLDRLREQVARYPIERFDAQVDALEGRCGAFVARVASRSWRASRIIFATGVCDRMPGHLESLWTLVRSGRVRLCPVCDAYEVAGRRIGVVCEGDVAAGERRYLADYSPHVACFAPADVAQVVTAGDEVALRLRSGELHRLDALYVACGVDVGSGLATALGASRDENGYLQVDQRQQTTVDGLYAAGDVVQSLSQISVAYGQAAIAASAVNVALNAERAATSLPKA